VLNHGSSSLRNKQDGVQRRMIDPDFPQIGPKTAHDLQKTNFDSSVRKINNELQI